MPIEKSGIGELFHQETKYHRSFSAGEGPRLSYPSSSDKGASSKLRRFPLEPVDRTDGKPIWKTIAERRSLREFARSSLSFEELSQLIWAIQGISARSFGFGLRTAPSAGALYPIETYVVVNWVETLPSGLYHYSVNETELILLKEGRFGSALSRAALEQEWLERASCVFIWTAVIERSKRKYRERAFRYIYMDAGHIGQNLYLAATALGLGCCTVGAFYDEEIDRLIGIDGVKEVSIYLGAVGKIGEY
jgi:SagB-type dehydrogenase family enzyme